MPLEERSSPSTTIKWNEVTLYSKSLAVFLFVALVCAAFFFGVWYQKQLTPIQIPENNTPKIDVTFSKVVNYVSAVPWVAPVATDSIYLERDGRIYVNDPDVKVELSEADVATFVVPDSSIAGAGLAYSYAKDKNNVYYRTRIDGSVSHVRNADPATFIVISGQTDYDAQDINHKFFAAGIICEDPTKSACVLEDGPGSGYGHWFQKLQ